MAKTPAEMEAAVLRNIPTKTGKTLDAWMGIIKRTGPANADNLKLWLQEKHGFGGGQAGILSNYYKNGGKTSYGDAEALLEGQYTGEKAQLRPIYDKLKKEISNLDKAIRFEPCKTYVSIIAKHQFAVAVPTKNSLKLGLALGEEVPENMVLKKTNQLAGDKITHYIPLKTKDDIKYAMGFIKEAYIRYRSTKKEIR